MIGKRWIVLSSSFLIMFLIGGTYAWSAFAVELIRAGYLSVTQSQIIFSTVSGMIPVYMVFAGRIERSFRSLRSLVWLGLLFFSGGYILSGLLGYSFLRLWVFIGLMTALGIGIIYTLGLGIPIRWFPPDRKGIVTGITVGGYGLGATVLPFVISHLRNVGLSVHQIFTLLGVIYLALIGSLSLFFDRPAESVDVASHRSVERVNLISDRGFWRLWFGIMCGSFSGILVIGNLKPMGLSVISNETVVNASISIFALANFMGRIAWGWVGDAIGSARAIVLYLLCSILGMVGLYSLSQIPIFYLISVFLVGFSYGANFVLYARETGDRYGVVKVTLIYPYVFLGHAVAGVFGPALGGLIYDLWGSYGVAIIISITVSLIGISLFIGDAFLLRRVKTTF